ncbi:MAG: prepilin-type N-terminal cleavage/methylation domain-containing protein [Actinomycetales bacterium]|nr:prepilin-type N-terminal cleavage/methylation domain-containing protein [Actinomycetales bacterium]
MAMMNLKRRFEARRRLRSSDDGFTLIELIIVVVIMPLIIGAIGYGLVSVFSLQNSVTQRLSGSTDLQKVSAQFIRDVQSANTVYLGPTPQECGVPDTGVVQLLGLAWGGGTTMVSYVRIPTTNNSSNYMLERLYCTMSNFTTPVSGSVMSSDFYVSQGSLVQNPPEVCQTSLASCIATSGSYNAHKLAAITFTMYVPMSSVPYKLVATPRGGTSGLGTNAFSLQSPFTLLGTTCTAGGALSVGNKVTLSVQQQLSGSATPTNASLGLANCPASAINLANGGSIAASGILTGSTSTDGISHGANPGSYPTSPPLYSPTLCNPFGPTPAPAGQTSNCPVPAPEQLTPPTAQTSCTSGVDCGVCSPSVNPNSTGVTYTCTAGYYASAPNFGNTSTITFTGILQSGSLGETTFGTELIIPNGSNATFDTGVYVYAGINSKDGLSFNTGTNGVAVTSGAGGVLFYSKTGGVTFQNNSLVKLKGITCQSWNYATTPSTCNSQYPPYYYDVTLWLDGTTNTPQTGNGVLTLANNTSQVNGYGGIYVPNGEVVLGNNGTINTAFIITSSAVFTASKNTSIGIILTPPT